MSLDKLQNIDYPNVIISEYKKKKFNYSGIMILIILSSNMCS